MVKIFNFENIRDEFSANTYVIGKVGGECIIIDLGNTSDIVYDYVKTNYEKVSAILLTHGHFDHIRGVSKFLKHYKDKYDIPVYIYKDDVELLIDPEKNVSKFHGENVVLNINPIIIENEDVLNIGKYQVQVIHTPYHTLGSVCYLFEDDNALFSGDSLFKGSIGRSDLVTSDSSLINSSLLKIKNLSDTLVIYPGHGDITKLADEKNYNPYLKMAK